MTTTYKTPGLLIILLMVCLNVFGAEKSRTVGHAINAKTFDNKPYSLLPSSMRKATVIMFSDSLCPFRHLPNCENKIKEFNRLQAKFGNQLSWLQIIKGYYVDKAHVQGYLKKFKINATNIWDVDNKIFTDYEVFANPYIVVLDKNGEIVFRKDAFVEELEQVLSPMTEQ